jgi:MoxR-like ATPase
MTTAAQTLETELKAAVGATVFGAEAVIHGLCLGLIAAGHVMLQGVPGVGKTLLARTLARHLGGELRRIQCTADLMPSDMTGIHVYRRDEFVLNPGPIFADVVLVDEINRTGPKTQSALLEAMEEGRVTIDRTTYPLAEGFFVIATENPHEFEGTFPLPESQLDRFLLRLEMGYPPPEDEQRVLAGYDRGDPRQRSRKPVRVLSDRLLPEARAAADALHVSEALYRYVIEIAAASRRHPDLGLGLSTRGALALVRCARAEAGLRGGEFAIPDDVKAVAPAVMAHRLILTPEASLEGREASRVVEELLEQVEVPRE